MHNGAKLTLGIGVAVFAVGILLTLLGARGIGAVEEFSVEGEAIWSGNSGAYVNEEDGGYGLLIFVSDEVRCDEFTLEVSQEGDAVAEYVADRCVEDGKLPSGHSDDPEGWLHMGTIREIEYGVSYEFSANEEFSVVPERVVVEVIGSAIGGIVAGLGGGSCACCGLFILFIGLVLALTMKEEVPTSYKVGPDGKIILDDSEAGNVASSGPGEGAVDDVGTWYEQN